MKMKNTLLGVVCMAILMSSSLTVKAQEEGDTESSPSGLEKILNTMSVGAHLGSVIFYGDLRVYDWYPVTKYHSEYGWGGGISLTKAFSPVLSLQGNIMMGSLKGTSRNKGVYFNGNTFENTLNLIVNLSNITLSKRGGSARKLGYYAVVGLGMTSFRTAMYSLSTDNFKGGYGYDGDIDTKSSRTTETIIPVGFGLKYKLNTNMALNLEFAYRVTNTDKIDVWSIEGSGNDGYQYTSVGFNYKFAKSDKDDVEWSNPLEDMYAQLLEGQAQLDGLSNDTDNDGVADIFDKEVNTPSGVAVDGSGKSLDIDEDGVADYMDADRFTPKGAKVDGNGRELDSDADGVPDSRDLEPNTPKGSLVNFQGVVINAKASETAGAAGSVYLPSVVFKVNSSKIDYSNYERLATVAQVLKNNADIKVNVVGNADKSGSESYNLELSKRRAQAVVDHLVKIYGLNASRFKVVARGSKDTLSKTGSSEFDRRVDFELAE